MTKQEYGFNTRWLNLYNCAMDLQPYSPEFFSGATTSIAPSLLGQYLVVNHPEYGPTPLTIVEVEAYTTDDPACHAYGYSSETAPKRAKNLFGVPGTAYVYFIYGMYSCLNVITEPKGTAGAVLIRGVVDVRPDGAFAGNNLIGPGRLCRDLGITVNTHNGLPMTDSNSGVYLAPSGTKGPTKTNVLATPRIGIRRATERLWRWIDSRYVSS